jgi:hypothetical protein
MHFDNFSLGARHLFQTVGSVILKKKKTYLRLYIRVIHRCFQNKNLSELLKKIMFAFGFFFDSLTLKPLEALREFSRPFCTLFTTI